MGASRLTVVLSGVAVNAILSAGTDLITTLEPEATLGMSAFMVGGFSGVSAARVYTAAAYIAPALLLAAVTAGRLDVLGLGDEVAQSVGMRVRRTRVGLLILASVLAGAAISFSGLLGFAGLIVPHALRHLTGGENRTLLPLSMLGGALFVLVCDTVARTAFAPYEGACRHIAGAPGRAVLPLAAPASAEGGTPVIALGRGLWLRQCPPVLTAFPVPLRMAR